MIEAKTDERNCINISNADMTYLRFFVLFCSILIPLSTKFRLKYLILFLACDIIIAGFYALNNYHGYIIVLLNVLVKQISNFKHTLCKIYSFGEVIWLFYDNLKTICDKQGVKITPIVLECGGNKGALSGWKKGAMPNSDIVMKLAVRLNVPTDCLLFGENYNLFSLSEAEKQLIKCFGSLNEFDKCKVIERAETLAELADERMIQENKKAPKEKAKPKSIKLPEPETTDESKNEYESEDEEETEYEEEYFEIPLAELPASAGTGIYLDSGQTETIKVAANEKTRQTDFAVKVSGDSMEPRYYSGDIVLVRDEPVRIGEIGIFVYEGEGYIKKLGDGCLISLNPKYPNIQIENPDSLFCQGRVISVLRLVKKRR